MIANREGAENRKSTAPNTEHRNETHARRHGGRKQETSARTVHRAKNIPKTGEFEQFERTLGKACP